VAVTRDRRAVGVTEGGCVDVFLAHPCRRCGAPPVASRSGVELESGAHGLEHAEVDAAGREAVNCPCPGRDDEFKSLVADLRWPSVVRLAGTAAEARGSRR